MLSKRSSAQHIERTIIALAAAVVFSNWLVGCDRKPTSESNTTSSQPSDQPSVAKSNTVGSQNQSPSKREFSAVENQIYRYIDSVGNNYGGDEKGDAHLLIDASKEFKKPIIEVYRIYTAIKESKSNGSLTDAESDTVNMRYLQHIGFVQRDGNWYFAGELVDMGTPLPAPDSMKPKQPLENQNIEVVIEASADISELKQLQIKGKTNLPNETDLMISLSSNDQNYSAQDKVTVRNGQFQSAWFSDSKRPLNRLRDGSYVVEISTPTVNMLKPSVKAALGENGRNMTGKLVKFDQIWGNRAKFETTVSVQ